jgi:hypothetical protein
MTAVVEGKDPATKKADAVAGTLAELHERYLEQHAKAGQQEGKPTPRSPR